MRRIVSYVGVKGGVGTTGAALADAKRRGGLAVDLDLAHGDLARRAGIDARSSLTDLAVLDANQLSDHHLDIVTYHHDRVALVASPATVELAELIDPVLVAAVLDLGGRRGEMVVDCGSRIDVRVLVALRAADEIVLVTRADDSCRLQLSRLLDLLDRAAVSARVSLHAPRTNFLARRKLSAAVGVPLRQEPRLAGWFGGGVPKSAPRLTAGGVSG